MAGTMNKAFWNNRSVFLTGHTGFKGTWMSLWLQQMGAKLTGYALAPDTTPSMFEVVQADQGMNSIINDVRDLASVQDAMQAAEPEVVIHMAAQPLVRDSYIYPVETFDTNVMGTVNVLEACRNCPTVRSVVVVTTDKCYENREWVWGYREDEPMGGHDPYSIAILFHRFGRQRNEPGQLFGQIAILVRRDLVRDSEDQVFHTLAVHQQGSLLGLADVAQIVLRHHAAGFDTLRRWQD